MIELLTSDTPNGKKISIMLEEVNFDYKDLKVKRYYEKPSEKRKRRLTESLRRRKKAARKIQLFQEKQESSRKRKWTSPIKEQLAKEKAFSPKNNPFRTVHSLIDSITCILEED